MGENKLKNQTQPLFIIRFIAAIAVVLYHYEPDILKNSFLHDLVNKFSEFVNFFYFISGFVLFIANQKYFANDKFPKKEFWAKRIARIYPSYFTALLLTLSFHYFVRPTFSSIYVRLPLEVLMLQTWIYNSSINYPSWSVSCELFFYLVFPYLTSILIKYFSKLNIFKVLGFFLFNLVVFASLNQLTVNQNSNFFNIFQLILNNHPIPRLAIFIVGIYCGYLFYNDKIGLLKNKSNSTIISCTFFVLIFIVLYLIPKNSNFLSFGILTPLYFIFVLSLTNINENLRDILSNKYFIYAGDISYGIYIFQFPVHLFFVAFIADTFILKWFALYLVSLIIVSIICYEFIELPLKAKIINFFQNK